MKTCKNCKHCLEIVFSISDTDGLPEDSEKKIESLFSGTEYKCTINKSNVSNRTDICPKYEEKQKDKSKGFFVTENGKQNNILGK